MKKKVFFLYFFICMLSFLNAQVDISTNTTKDSLNSIKSVIYVTEGTTFFVSKNINAEIVYIKSPTKKKGKENEIYIVKGVKSKPKSKLIKKIVEYNKQTQPIKIKESFHQGIPFLGTSFNSINRVIILVNTYDNTRIAGVISKYITPFYFEFYIKRSKSVYFTNKLCQITFNKTIRIRPPPIIIT